MPDPENFTTRAGGWSLEVQRRALALPAMTSCVRPCCPSSIRKELQQASHKTVAEAITALHGQGFPHAAAAFYHYDLARRSRARPALRTVWSVSMRSAAVRWSKRRRSGSMWLKLLPPRPSPPGGDAHRPAGAIAETRTQVGPRHAPGIARLGLWAVDSAASGVLAVGVINRQRRSCGGICRPPRRLHGGLALS